MNSSDLTKRLQNRTIFYDITRQRTQFEQGLVSRIIYQQGGNKASGIIIDSEEGSVETTPEELSTIITTFTVPRAVVVPPTPPPVETKGSITFSGATTSPWSYISVPNDIDLRMGFNDFTIEWYQFWTGGSSASRIFSIGNYPSASMSVSYEGGTFYYWRSGGYDGTTFSYPAVSNQNVWQHVAITRYGGVIRIFINGVSKLIYAGISDNFNNSSSVLAIGQESTPSAPPAFAGKITNFHWVKGTALYDVDFTPPSVPIQPVENTKLLLLASSSGSAYTDSSAVPKTVTNYNTAWSSNSP